jgi:hypothetical protein
MKVYGGTAPNGDRGLCASCRFATIVRGRSLDEEVVQCLSAATRGMRVTFKVTSCTAHSPIDQPTYIQLLADAWVLHPGTRRKPAGFVKYSEIKAEEVKAFLADCSDDEM